MKIFKNFGMLPVILAIPMLLVSCAKDFQDEIDDLNNKYSTMNQRVTNLESQVEKMNNELNTLSALAKAVESGFYVTGVKTNGDSYELTLNNGQKIVLQNGPDKTMTAAPYISMSAIGDVHYWTVNGMLITDKDGKPIPATGSTPVVKYDTTKNQWVISVDGGKTFQNMSVFASIVINDEVLLQVINTYISQNSTTLISQEMLFQIITTYIQQNYSSLFNTTILNEVIVNYLEKNYTTIFNLELLEQLFAQYNYQYATNNIDVDIITQILIDFIQNHTEVFVNNDVLFEIINSYVEINKSEVFNTEIIAEVINNYISNNTNFINIELLTQIVNNYMELHQDIIFDNQNFINILQKYVEENYMVIFSQNILSSVVNNYITQNKTTIFNETLIREIVNNYVQNNYSFIFSNEMLTEIINNYISVNKNTVINETILYEVISNYFKTNYNIFIDETLIQQIINNYITQNQTTLIDIDIVRQVVNTYVRENIYTILDVNILNQLITNYFEQNTTIIQQYVSQYVGIIKDVFVNNDVCTITLNNGQIVQLTVYDAFARIRDRVQSIVVVPNMNGHVSFYSGGWGYLQLSYLVTPSSLAPIITDKYYQNGLTVEFLALDSNGNLYTLPTSELNLSTTYDGMFNVSTSNLYGSSTITSIALRVKDNTAGGTDYTTTFTPIDYTDTHPY